MAQGNGNRPLYPMAVGLGRRHASRTRERQGELMFTQPSIKAYAGRIAALATETHGHAEATESEETKAVEASDYFLADNLKSNRRTLERIESLLDEAAELAATIEPTEN